MKSPTKLEIDMARMETELKNTQDTVKEIKEQVKTLATKEDLNEIKDTLKAFIKGADEKFAGKWVESVWRLVFTIIGTAILGGLLSLIIIKK